MGRNRKRAAAVGVAAVAVVALAACGGHKTADAARASSLATGSAAAAAKANLAVISARCGTTTAAGQIAAARDMTSKADRQKLWAKCGVPAAKRRAVETEALAASEKAHLVSGGHAARATYFEVTLPKIIESNES